ncbi:MAG: hypothetical protein AB1782_19620 [Cyanobacteriota bacterium]
MDSKRQSKLPDGLGKKIIQALKTQDPEVQTGQAAAQSTYQEVPVDPYAAHQPDANHGLETISHMDFGSQEMHYDEEPGPLEPTEFQPEMTSELPDLDGMTTTTDTPQYGSFAPIEEQMMSEETPMSIDYNEQSYDQPSYDQQSYDPQSFDPQRYEQQAQDDFNYNQQSYDDFSDDIQQFEDDSDVPEYQPPQLGYSQGRAYQEMQQQPALEEVDPPETEDYPQEFTEYQPYETQEYQEYTPQPAHASHAQANIGYNQYSYQEDDYNQQLEPEQYEPEPYQPHKQEMSTYDSYEPQEVQIGYPQQQMNQNQQWEEIPRRQEPQRTIDLDSIHPGVEPQYAKPQEPSKSPLDLDQYQPKDYNVSQERDPHITSPPVKPEPYKPDNRSYHEPQPEPRKHYAQDQSDHYRPRETHPEPYRPDDRGYRETHPEPYRPDDRGYRETHSEPYRPDDRGYRETHPEPYRPDDRGYNKHDDRSYHEPHRDSLRYDDRSYQESSRDYHRYDDRLYHDSSRDYHRYDDRSYNDMSRDRDFDPRRDERATRRRVELFNSNVETLIKLVSTLPPGVTRQTGAQIIRQTMEAMGISMSEVLSDAQGAQAKLQKYMKDNINKIEEQKQLIRQLEDDISYYQRRAKELDDLINLFIIADKDMRRL